MAQAEAPCTRWKDCAKLSGSALTTKLMSPWRQSVTRFERWRATGAKPSEAKVASSCAVSGPVNSTNSKPSVPIGLRSETAPATAVRSGGMSMDAVPSGWERSSAGAKAKSGGMGGVAGDLRRNPPGWVMSRVKSATELDAADRRILRVLQRDGR